MTTSTDSHSGDLVWVPGAQVDLEGLRREYDTIVFTRAAVRSIDYDLQRLIDELELAVAQNGIDDAGIETILDDARASRERLGKLL